MLRRLSWCTLALVLALPLGQSVIPTPGPSPAVMGAWSEPFEGEEAAVTMALLRDGRVLYWGGADSREVRTVGTFIDAPGRAHARLLEFGVDGPIITIPTPEDGGAGDLFCAGQSFLADGRLLAAGGTRYAPLPQSGGFHLFGLRQSMLFEPMTDAFARSGDMLAERWYPTVLTLPDGDALVFGGTGDLFAPANVALPERFGAATGEWSPLDITAINVLPLYPHVHAVPSGPYRGQVAYVPGGCTSCTNDDAPAWHTVQTLDLATQRWTSHASSVVLARDYGASVPLALRPPEYDAVYAALGGGVTDAVAGIDATVGSPQLDLVDFSVAPPAVTLASPMRHARWYGHGIALPTGDVLAVGGATTGHKMSTLNPPVLAAELLDPDAVDPATGLRGRWTELASGQVARGYHSTALLLPDARVLVGGHVPLPAVGAHAVLAYETRFEIFSPPYLFQEGRPEILDAPANLTWGQAFDIGIERHGEGPLHAVLVRPGATTHVVDTEQRVVELVVTEERGDGLTALAPPDAHLAPPGWWMLFLIETLDGVEVPSVARFVHLG